MVAGHLRRMGYATLVQVPKSISEEYSVICTKTCQSFQQQASIQTGLMALFAKKVWGKV